MSAGRRKARRWVRNQARDPWVRKARARGLPSRAAFKLEEVARRFALLEKGQRVLELGAAPGGWTRLAVAAVGAAGRVVAVDRLAMTAPAGAVCILGDLREPAVRAAALEALGGPADVVLCDIAPNITGVREVDAAHEAELCGLAAEVAAASLKPGGALLIKLFAGAGSTGVHERIGREYRQVRRLKPQASRARSSEFYLLARGFRGGRAPGAL